MVQKYREVLIAIQRLSRRLNPELLKQLIYLPALTTEMLQSTEKVTIWNFLPDSKYFKGVHMVINADLSYFHLFCDQFTLKRFIDFVTSIEQHEKQAGGQVTDFKVHCLYNIGDFHISFSKSYRISPFSSKTFSPPFSILMASKSMPSGRASLIKFRCWGFSLNKKPAQSTRWLSGMV